MRDSCLNSVEFESVVKKVIGSSSNRINFLTTSVSDSPNFLDDFEQELVLSSRKLDDLVALSVISWYVPKSLSILLRLELEKKMESEDFFVLGLLLESKTQMILFLQETRLWHIREFYGNILREKQIKYLLKKLHFRRRKTRKPQRSQWKRGYRDKGSRRIDSDRHEFITYSAELKQHEFNQDTRQDTLSFLAGFLGSGG